MVAETQTPEYQAFLTTFVSRLNSLDDAVSSSFDLGEFLKQMQDGIKTGDEAKSFFGDVGDKLGTIGDFLDLAERGAIVAESPDPTKALFVQSVDLLFSATIDLAGVAVTFFSAGVAPPLALAAGLGALAAHLVYTVAISDQVQEWADSFFEHYVENPDSYIVSIASIAISKFGDTQVQGSSIDDFFAGGTGNDSLTGGGGTNTLLGGSGNDTLYDNGVGSTLSGGDDNDHLQDSGSGSQIDGGAGNDFLYLDRSGLTTAVALTLQPGLAQTLPDGTTFQNIEHYTVLTGSGDDSVSFVAPLWDSTWGGNSWYAGDGLDTATVDLSGDTGGVRTIWGYYGQYQVQQYQEGIWVDTVTLYGVEKLNIIGGSGGDNLFGSNGDDTLTGNAGGDTLTGGGGNDILNGGSGVDQMDGGANDDIYYVDNAGDVVTEAVGGGTDTVYAGVNWTLTTGSEVEVIRANTGTISLTLTGNEFANTIYGAGGNDTLNGAGGNDTLVGNSGADTMAGGTGNDAYYVDNAGDVVTEAVGGGTDTAYTKVSYALAAGSEVEVLQANGGTNLTLTGNEFNNTIVGWSGNDTLNGEGGNDVLSGLTGADTMSGGQGNDIYYVDNAGDVVTEAVGGGTDTVYAGVNWTLTTGSEVEFLRANTGATGLSLTGNELANQIFGGTGSDTLAGGAGSDRLTGGTGADTFAFGKAGSDDIVTDFNWNQGDRVRLDGISLQSATAKDVDGNGVDDTILQFSDGSATLLNTGDISAHYNGLFVV